MEELSYNIFKSIQFCDVSAYNQHEMHNVLIVGIPAFLIVSLFSNIIHLIEFFNDITLKWHIIIMCVIGVILSSLIIETILFFLMFQIPIPKLIIATFLIIYVSRFVVRLNYEFSFGFFTKIYLSGGLYIEKKYNLYELQRGHKKYYTLLYKEKLNNNRI